MDKVTSYAVGLINRLKNLRQKINQRIVLRLIPVVLILIGLVASVYLVQQRQVFRSRAAQEGQVEVVNQNGQTITAKDVQGNIQVGSPQVRLKITPPTWSQSSPQGQGFQLIKSALAQEGSSTPCGTPWTDYSGQQRTTICSDKTQESEMPGCIYLQYKCSDSSLPNCWACPKSSGAQPTPAPASPTPPPTADQRILCGTPWTDYSGQQRTTICSEKTQESEMPNCIYLSNYKCSDQILSNCWACPYSGAVARTPAPGATATTLCGKSCTSFVAGSKRSVSECDFAGQYLAVDETNGVCNAYCAQIPSGNSKRTDGCGFEPLTREGNLPTPQPDVTEKVRISLTKDLIDFRNSGVSCNSSQDPRQNCSELTYTDLINQSIITWNLPNQPGIYSIWVSFYSAQKRYKEISITVNYLPGALESVQPPLGQVVDRIVSVPEGLSRRIIGGIIGGPASLIRPPEGVPTVSTQQVVIPPSGVPAANPALGGQVVKVPAQPGAVAVINTPVNASVPMTVLVPARDVPMFVRFQPEPIRALPQPLVQGATAVAVLNLDFYRADTLESLRTHPQPVTISVQVTPALLAAAQNNPALLSIVRFDRERNEYLRLPTVYDAQRGVLSAETSETSIFSVVALPPRLALLAVDEPTALPGLDRVGYLPYLSNGVGGWNTGFQIENLGDVPATVSVEYFWASDLFAGSSMRKKSSRSVQLSSKNSQQAVLAVQAVQIPPRSSFTFFGPTFEIEEGFQGSAVISSAQPVSVIVYEIGSGGRLSASYAGTTRPSRVQYLPILMRENRGWNTELFVQNAGSGELTDGVVEILDGGGNEVATVRIPTLPPGYSFRVDQALQEGLGTSFVGSARVRGSQPLATMVNETNGRTLLSYSGFSGGQRKLSMPLITNDNRGWFTSLQVQNVGERESEVTLYVGGEVADVVRIAASGLHTWFPVPGTAPGFVGSATAVGEAGARLVGIVNEVHLPSAQGMSYRAFTTGTDLVEMPLIMTDNYGWYTGIQVQNIGSTAATVTLKVNGEAVEEAVIAAGQSKTWYPVPGTSQGFIGAATVEGSLGSQLVGIVNQVNLADLPGDTSLVYEGTNR